METIESLFEKYGGEIIYDGNVISEEVVDEYRWNVLVETILEVGGKFYRVYWQRAKVENGEDVLPDSLDEFVQVYKDVSVRVITAKAWVEDPEYVAPTPFEKIESIVDKDSARSKVDNIDELKELVKNTEDNLRNLEEISNMINLAAHVIATKEYLHSLQQFLEHIE